MQHQPPVVRGLVWARSRNAPLTPTVPRGVAPAVRVRASVHACSRGPATRGAQGCNQDQEASTGGAPARLTRMRWVVDRVRCTGGVGGDRAGPASCWSPGEPMTGSRAQAAVIAHGDASVRQHVRAEPTQARCGCHRPDADLLRGRCLGLQGDRVICPRAEAMVADGHAHAGRCSIVAGVLAGADGLAGHDPSRVPARGVHPRAPGGLGPWRAARGAEAHGAGRDVDQDVWPGSQPGARGRQTAAGHAIMPVRMGAPSAGPRLAPPTIPSRPPLHRGSTASAGQAAAARRKRRWSRVFWWRRARALRATGRVKVTRT